MTRPLYELAGGLPYGCTLWYRLELEGVPVLLLEALGDFVAPAGYTADASLAIEGTPPVGGVISQADHMPGAYDLAFAILDTPVTRALFARAAAATVFVDPEVDQVASTDGFAAAGAIYVGRQGFFYTGKTSNTFTGQTPVTYTGGHVPLSTSTYEAGQLVTSTPRYWVGRRVALVAMVMDPLGRYAVGDEAVMWTGYIVQRPRRTGLGWQFTARSTERRLAEPLLSTGSGRGRWSLEDDSSIWVHPSLLIIMRVYKAGVLLDDVALAPFGTTELLLISVIRQRIAAAWAAAVTAPELGGLAWEPTILSGTSGMRREYVAKIYVDVLADTSVKVRTGVTGINAPVRAHASEVLSYVELGGAWADANLRMPANVRDASLSVTLEGLTPADVPQAGWIRVGTGTESAILRYLSHTTHPADASRIRLEVAPDSRPELAVIAAQDDTDEGLQDFDVEFLWRAAGSVSDVLQALITGTGLDSGQGYGLTNVDADSFAAVFDGAFLGLSPAILATGQVSIDSLFGGLLRLSRRGIAASMALDGSGVEVRAVSLAPADLSTPATVVITGADLAWTPQAGAPPVRTLQLSPPAGRLLIESELGAGDEKPAPITIRNVEGDEWGSVPQTYRVWGIPPSALLGPATAWAQGIFANAESRQLIEIDVVPWVGARARHGDVVALQIPDPAAWGYLEGSPGYTGPGRVWGVQPHLESALITLTVEIDGVTAAASLSPAAPVLAWEPSVLVDDIDTAHTSTSGYQAQSNDIEVHTAAPVTMTHFRFKANQTTTAAMRLYYRTGTSVGYTSSITGWTLLFEGNVVMTAGALVTVELPVPLVLAGGLNGFYLTPVIAASQIRYVSGAHVETSNGDVGVWTRTVNNANFSTTYANYRCEFGIDYLIESNQPSSVDIPVDYAPVMEAFLEGVASFKLVVYKPGLDSPAQVLDVNSVTVAGGVCVLGISGTTGAPHLTGAASTWWVTLPSLAVGNAAQALHLHTGQGVAWT